MKTFPIKWNFTFYSKKECITNEHDMNFPKKFFNLSNKKEISQFENQQYTFRRYCFSFKGLQETIHLVRLSL